MNELQIFENPEFGSIRTVEIGGEQWLVGKDVATALGYRDTGKAIRVHVDNEDKLTRQFGGSGQNRDMTIINESGLYALILSSKLPGAKKFKRWVTNEVLPSIRRTGSYTVPGKENAPVSEKTAADLTAAILLLIERLDGQGEQKENLPFAQEDEPPFAPMALPEATAPSVPGPAAKKRWMRIVSEKLDLLSARKGNSHNSLLHQTYKIIEKNWGISLEEERLRVVEEMNLADCSVLAAIFYTDELKDHFEQIVDLNLAPENRGW